MALFLSKLPKFQTISPIIYGCLIILVGIALVWSTKLHPSDILNLINRVNAIHIAHPWELRAIFVALVFVLSATSMPANGILLLMGGALIGWWTAPLYLIAATGGGTIAFWISRTILRDWTAKRFSSWANATDRDQYFIYLVALRISMVVPFFILNNIAGVLPISTRVFIHSTWIGIIPSVVLYTYAGQELMHIRTLHDLVDSRFIFLAVGVGAVLILAAWVRHRMGIQKPKKNGQ